MIRKVLSMVLVLCMMIVWLPIPQNYVKADSIVWEGGIEEFSLDDEELNNSEDNPYIIDTPEKFAMLAKNVNDGITYEYEYFKLTSDIFLNNATDWESWNDGTQNLNVWTSIGNEDNHFKGIFDGDNHTISGIYINKDEEKYQGLFGYIEGAVIKNIKIEKGYIKGYQYVGGIVGCSVNSLISNCEVTVNLGSRISDRGGIAGYIIKDTTITDCKNTGTIGFNEFGDKSGGIVGLSKDSSIMNCINEGPISGMDNVGGIVGYSTNSKNEGINNVINCINKGSIKGDDNVGGIVGISSTLDSNNFVEYCVNTGEVTATGSCGGIIGNNNGIMQYCYNIGKVSANNPVGGLVGLNGGNIQYCYNTGVVSGKIFTGGLVGNNGSGKIENCYNAGNTKIYKSGGIVGYNSANVINCFYDKQMWISSYSILSPKNSEGPEGKLTNEMIGSTLENNLGDSSKWVFQDGLYPRLVNNGDFNMNTTDEAYVSAIPIFLTDDEKADNITKDFALGVDNDVIWTSSNEDTVNINGGNATVQPQSSKLTLTASINDVYKDINISTFTPLYTVTYIANGGTEPVPTQEPLYEGMIFKAGDELTRENYKFVYWSDGTDNYWSGSSYTMGSKDLALTAIWRPNAPTEAPELESFTDTMITVKAVDGYEYRNNGWDWQESNVFTELDPATEYIIFSRIKANGLDLASKKSPPLIITTDNITPSAPEVKSKTDSTITLISVEGQEYSIDNGISWQDSNVFTGLSSNTSYMIVTRIKETEESMASDISPATMVTTKKTTSSSSTDSKVKSKTKTDSNFVDVIVNDEVRNVGTKTSSVQNGRTISSVSVSSETLQDILSTEGNGTKVIFLINTLSDVATSVLNGQMVKNMETKESTLSVQRDYASYTLPASAINISSVSEEFGKNVELKDIEVEIEIAKPIDDMTTLVNKVAEENGFSSVVSPVEFSVDCTYNGKTINVDTFDSYVERTIEIPENTKTNKITTAVVVEPDETVRHVPTKITVLDGKYYAVINSLTNSVYTLIYNQIDFTDVEKEYWAYEEINDMASRKILSGYKDGTYLPEGNITRAEFATILVRALGLAESKYGSSFIDISKNDWYCGAVETATNYGLITGYPDGTFHPNENITREQAMVIIARAMEITKLSAEIDDNISTDLNNFLDVSDIQDYSRESVINCLNTGIITGKINNTLALKDSMTRAEVAVVVKRLLIKSNLI